MLIRYIIPTFILCITLAVRAGSPAASREAAPDDGNVVRLDRMVVSTATRTERLLADVPVRTEVVLSEDIGMRASLNFSQAAELLNGVRVESNCQNCNTSEVQLLGLGGAYSQILFDGTPLLSSLGGVYGIEQIPSAFVDRLEVVKGGGSSLYGPGAVAGVINLVPAKPRAGGGFAQAGVDVQKGEPLWFGDGRADFVAKGGAFAMSVVAQGARNDSIDFNGDGYSEITKKELAVAGFQAWWSPSPSTRLRAAYQYTGEDRRGGNRLDQPEYLANIAESLQTRYHRGGVVWEQDVGRAFDFRLGYSFAYIERDSFYGGLGDVATDPGDPAYDPAQLDPAAPGSAAAASYRQYGYTENPLHYIDSQFNCRAGAHALAFGVQYKHEAVFDENRNHAGEALRVTADGDFSNTGIYAQDEWAAADSLDFVLGARLDKSSELDNPVFSPRVAAAWAATEALKIRAGVSTGFRAPEVFSEDLHVDTLGADQVRIRNAPGLAEERAVTCMAGLEWRFGKNDTAWAVDLTFSLTDIDDTFVLGEILADTGGSLYQERRNASGSRIEGVEANAAWQPFAALRLTAGVAWYRSRYDEGQVIYDDTPDGGATVIATRNYLKTPAWSGVAQAVWTPFAPLDVFAGLKYTGPMDVLNNNTGTLNRSPDFWVADIGFVWHASIAGRHVDFSAGVKNIFDERQRDLETGANRDSDYVHGPRFARSVYCGVKVEF
jgi:outer membrane receptor for ferrienterochelin and colicins